MLGDVLAAISALHKSVENGNTVAAQVRVVLATLKSDLLVSFLCKSPWHRSLTFEGRCL